MTIANQLYHCCSVIEVGQFSNWQHWGWKGTNKSILISIKRAIREFFYNEDYDVLNPRSDYPKVVIATTNGSQKRVEQALIKLGFTVLHKFPSRHDKGSKVTCKMWIYNGPMRRFFE